MTTQNSLLKALSRRNLLQHAPLLGLLAPVFRRRDAGAAALAPRRVILLFSPNGNMEQIGPATGTETAFTMSDWWKPLERHKADGIFMSHMACTGSNVVPGNGHGLGGQNFSGYGTGSDQYAQQGETVDQRIGKRLESEKRGGARRSVVWGLQKNSSAGGTGDAFASAADRNITPETDPSKAWAEIFAGFMAPNPGAVDTKRAAALIARDQSILDFAGKDCAALKGQLGTEGTRLLDEHCNSIRSMETALKNAAMPGAASSCAKPADPGAKNWLDAQLCDSSMAAFTTLIANTLACELSHVVAFQFGAQASRNSLSSTYAVPNSPQADSGDSGASHHPWTHQGRSTARTKAMSTFNLFYAEKVALLVDKLKTTIDASGKPLSDSTVVLWLPELGGGQSNQDAHQTGQLPIVMFGNGQGTFKTGRYLRGKSDPNNNRTGGGDDKEAGRDTAKILISMMQYMGLKDANTIGKSDAQGTFPFLYGA